MQSNKQPVGQPAVGPNAIVNRQATTNNRRTILSVDLGRTSTKACVSRNPNEVVFIPSNVAQLTVEKARGGGFESRDTDPLLDLWLEYRGDGYAVGQLAADFGANLFGGDTTDSPSKVDDALIFSCPVHDHADHPYPT